MAGTEWWAHHSIVDQVSKLCRPSLQAVVLIHIGLGRQISPPENSHEDREVPRD